MSEQEPSRTVRGIVTLAALVIVIAGMREASSLLLPFLVAAFLAMVGASPLFWLTGKGIPSVLAVLLVVLVLLSLFSLAGVLVGTSVNDFYRAIPLYQERFQQESVEFYTWLEEKGLELPTGLLAGVVEPGAVMRLAASLLSSLGGLITNAFVILLTVVFMLLEASSFPAKFKSILIDPNVSFRHFSTIAENINRYVALKTVVSAATGLLVGTWMALLGIDFAVLWGLLAFLLNYIPNIGSIIAAVPPTLLGVVQYGPGTALLVLGGFLVVNFVLGSLIEPRLMGYGLDLSTLVVFLSLVFWQWVLGPVGMLLSVPLTMTLKIALESHEDTRWVAVLLGSAKSIGEVESARDETKLANPSQDSEAVGGRNESADG